MLDFPKSTAFGRRFPKQKFYENLDVSAEVKRLFVEQVKLITWANKLSPETMNIAPGQMVREIEVFRLTLQGQELDGRVLELMDKQISPDLERLMEGRQIYQHKGGEDGIPLCADDGRFFLDTVAPILSEGDVLGSVVFTSPEEELGGGEVEYKLAQSIAAFLGKHMES